MRRTEVKGHAFSLKDLIAREGDDEFGLSTFFNRTEVSFSGGTSKTKAEKRNPGIGTKQSQRRTGDTKL